jgi:hypothetical protein
MATPHDEDLFIRRAREAGFSDKQVCFLLAMRLLILYELGQEPDAAGRKPPMREGE